MKPILAPGSLDSPGSLSVALALRSEHASSSTNAIRFPAATATWPNWYCGERSDEAILVEKTLERSQYSLGVTLPGQHRSLVHPRYGYGTSTIKLQLPSHRQPVRRNKNRGGNFHRRQGESTYHVSDYAGRPDIDGSNGDGHYPISSCEGSSCEVTLVEALSPGRARAGRTRIRDHRRFLQNGTLASPVQPDGCYEWKADGTSKRQRVLAPVV